MNDLISVVVPAYNIENYIERCIKSILNQTYSNIEVIIVDDGSTDNTGSIIDKYALKDHRVIPLHKENGGVSSARMEGIDRAKGEWIGFVDGDDVIEENMYEVLLNNAIEYNADISHCGYQMVFPDGHVDYYYGTKKNLEQNKRQGLIDLIKGDFIEPGLWNKLYKKSIVKKAIKSKIWNCNIRINEDLLMNYLIFKESNKSIYYDRALYHYILRKGSAAVTHKEEYQLLDPLRVIKTIKDDLIDDELYKVAYLRYLRILINISLQNDWEKAALMAKKELKIEIKKGNIRKYCISKKVEIMAVGVVYFFPIYKVIRRIYESSTKVNEKYNV